MFSIFPAELYLNFFQKLFYRNIKSCLSIDSIIKKYLMMKVLHEQNCSITSRQIKINKWYFVATQWLISNFPDQKMSNLTLDKRLDSHYSQPGPGYSSGFSTSRINKDETSDRWKIIENLKQRLCLQEFNWCNSCKIYKSLATLEI